MAESYNSAYTGAEIDQAVGKSLALSPATKTAAMTQPVGQDGEGKLWTEPGGEVDPEDVADAVTDWLDQHVDPETGYVIDNSLTVEGAAADAKAVGAVRDAVGELVNLAEDTTWTANSGIRWATGGTISNSALKRSGYIPVNGASVIVYTRMQTTGDSSPANGIAFYSDTDPNTYISGKPSAFNAAETGGAALYPIPVPESARYLRATWWKDGEKLPFAVYDADAYYSYLPNRVQKIEAITPYTDLNYELTNTASLEDGIINTAGICQKGTSRSSYELQNNGYGAVTIKAAASNSTWVSFLTASIHDLPSGSAVKLCDGSQPRYVVAAGDQQTFLVPDDCTFLVFSNMHPDQAAMPDSGALHKSISPMVSLAKREKQLPELSILFIGNSLDLDAVSYAPAILSSLGVEVNLTIGIMYYGGRTLRLHYNHFIAGDSVYTLYVSSNLSPWLTALSSASADDILAFRAWDVISFQQVSFRAGTYSTYQPYLTDLVDYICNHVDYKWKMAWHITPANPRINPGAYNPDDPDDIDETTAGTLVPASEAYALTESNYTAIVTALDALLAENPIEIVFPVATALQNARNTSLNDLDYGYAVLSYDGKHAQEGIACQVEGYTIAIKILELLGIHNRSILNDDTVIDAEFETAWNIPGQHGSPVGSGENDQANRRIAQKCAIMACQRPLQKSNILVPST